MGGEYVCMFFQVGMFACDGFCLWDGEMDEYILVCIDFRFVYRLLGIMWRYLSYLDIVLFCLLELVWMEEAEWNPRNHLRP